MKVLIAIDPSTHGGAAARRAAQRHWPRGTALRVVTVFEPVAVYYANPAHEMQIGSMFVASRAAVEQLAAKTAASLRGKGREVSSVVRSGHPADEIVEEAQNWSADLIMVGSHGRQRLSRLLLGSVAQRVAAQAPCSVEIVRESPFPQGGWNILLATDGSRFSDAAVRSAVAEPWPPNTTFRVVSVLEYSDALYGESGGYGFGDFDRSFEKLRRVASQRVLRVVQKLRRSGRSATSVIRTGHPVDEILAEAKRWKADLILVGTHGRRRLSRLLLGSVAERVAARAPCSVRIVRKKNAK